MGRRRNVERDRRIVRLARSARHMTHAQIGEATGVSRDTVLRVLRTARAGGAARRGFAARHRSAVESVEGTLNWNVHVDAASRSDLVLRNHAITGRFHELGKLAALPSAHTGALRTLTRHDDFWVRYSAAANPNCTPSVLAAASQDPAAAVRGAAAANPNCPPALVAVLANDQGDASVVRDAAGNPNCPTRILAGLADDEWWEVRAAVAGNPNCPTKLTEHFACDPDEGVVVAVAGNPNCPTKLLVELANRGTGLRTIVAGNPNCPTKLLARLATVGGNTTRAVANNPSTPTELLRRITGDQRISNRTRSAADRQLRERGAW